MNDRSPGKALPAQLLTLSNRSAESLDRQVESLATYLATPNAATISEVAYHLQIGCTQQAHRACFVARDRGEALSVVRDRPRQSSAMGHHDGPPRQVAFMFPGQGAQYLGMGRDLYEHSQVFRQALDECDRHLCDVDLLDALFAESAPEATARLQDTAITQPAIFSVSHALFKLWQSFGIQPVAMVGHSIGEFVAGCAAGVMSLPDAVQLIAERGRLMSELPRGSMLSVRAAAEAIEPHLSGDLVIASYNSPRLCVVAGPTDQVNSLAGHLEREHVAAKRLFTSHAFHSPMMDEIVVPFQQTLAQVKLSPPQVPIYSTVTGRRLTAAEATDPSYWANHLRLPVRFADAVGATWESHPTAALVELGPRKTLASLAKQVAGKKSAAVCLPSMADTADNHMEWRTLLVALGTLWTAGCQPDWRGLHPEHTHRVRIASSQLGATQLSKLDEILAGPQCQRDESKT